MNKVERIIMNRKQNREMLEKLESLKVGMLVVFDSVTYEVTKPLPCFVYLMPVEYHLQKYFKAEQDRFGYQSSFRGFTDDQHEHNIHYDMIEGEFHFAGKHKETVIEEIPLQYNVPEYIRSYGQYSRDSYKYS